MNWKLQGVGLIAGAILAAIPMVFGLKPYSGPGGTAVSESVFASSWNNLASVMQYPLLASLAFVSLGIVWKGSGRRRSAWLQLFFSFCLGCGLLFSLVDVVFTNIDAPTRLEYTLAAQNLLGLGLLAPTLSFVSSLTWLLLPTIRKLVTGIQRR